MIKKRATFLTGLIGLSVAISLTRGVTPSFAQSPNSANSNWEICNETSFILRVATASIIAGTMSTKGWTRASPSECITVNAPKDTPRFVYAESDPVHQGGIREWKGKANLCVANEDFISDATRDCAAQNMFARGYLQVDPTQKRTSLIEPDNFGTKADVAGIQRLLSDNGFPISRIDGIMGRRTLRTLNEFLKKAEISKSVSNLEKIKALSKAAESIQDGLGLTLCNEAAERIWTAIAFRDKSGWESKGWWPINSGVCVRPFTESLSGKDVHYFALREQSLPADAAPNSTPLPDKKLKNLAPTPSQFCVAEAQFSADGREYCADKGYRAENFRAVMTEEMGQKIILMDADFVDMNPSGLRR